MATDATTEPYAIRTLEDLEAYAAMRPEERTPEHHRAYLNSGFTLVQTKRAQESLQAFNALIAELAAERGITPDEMFERIFGPDLEEDDAEWG